MKNQPELTKREFVAILKEAGLTEEQMNAFHRAFERRAPDAHQQFLEHLQIEAEEISRIRNI